jgi:hypothetical protein
MRQRGISRTRQSRQTVRPQRRLNASQPKVSCEAFSNSFRMTLPKEIHPLVSLPNRFDLSDETRVIHESID